MLGGRALRRVAVVAATKVSQVAEPL